MGKTRKGKQGRRRKAKPSVVFTPKNEPYLGLEALHVFDKLVISGLGLNNKFAEHSFRSELTSLQSMASQVIPQGISLALSIRELIRQGYLFGAHVLVRPLAERAAILLYLRDYPEAIDVWNRGWNYREAPSLAKMFDAIQEKWSVDEKIEGKDLTAMMNSLVHGKPDSIKWNLLLNKEGKLVQASSKIIDRPDLCVEVCMNSMGWLAVIAGLMESYFPVNDTN